MRKFCLKSLQENGDTERRKIINKDPSPAPIIPRNINKKLKLLDIDPLELARQLTIMEYELFTKVRPMECILRSREQRQGKVDHITALIQSTNLVSSSHTKLWMKFKCL
jgi:son of sevenless-like protein